MVDTNRIPAAIRALFESEKRKCRDDLSITEAAWAYGTFCSVINSAPNLPPIKPLIIGGISNKIYYEWEIPGVERHGKPVKRLSPDLDMAIVISENRIWTATEQAKKMKLSLEYTRSKNRMTLRNFNEIGIDVNCNGMIGKCIPVTEAFRTGNDFILESTPVRVINEPYSIVSKMAASADRGVREIVNKDEIDIVNMVYVRYGSLGYFFSAESSRISEAVSRGYTTYFDIHNEQKFRESLRSTIAHAALCDELQLSVLRGISRDSEMISIREKVMPMLRKEGFKLELAKNR